MTENIVKKEAADPAEIKAEHTAGIRRLPAPGDLGAAGEGLPAFLADCLPDQLRRYTEAVSESIQAPLDMAIQTAVAAVSACVQGKYEVEAKPGWRQPLNLYMMIIARPSERKSAVLSEITDPIYDYIAEENEKRMQQTDPGDRARGGKKKLLLDDITWEALAKVMQENGGCAGIFSAEGKSFARLVCGNRSGNTDLIYKAYSGEHYCVDRISRGEAELPCPLLTTCLLIQPVAAKQIIGDKRAGEDGLLSRFLYSVPRSMVGKRQFWTKPAEDGLKEEFSSLLRSFLAVPMPDAPGKRVIRLSREAREVLASYYRKTETGLLREYREVEAWAGKLTGNVVRIAALFHLVIHGTQACSAELAEDTMRCAARVGDYYAAHTMAVFGCLQGRGPQAVRDAEYILGRLERQYARKGLTDAAETQAAGAVCSKRDLWKACRGRFGTAEEMEPGFRELADRGYISSVTVGPGQQGGRPSEVVCFTPEYLRSRGGEDAEGA